MAHFGMKPAPAKAVKEKQLNFSVGAHSFPVLKPERSTSNSCVGLITACAISGQLYLPAPSPACFHEVALTKTAYEVLKTSLS